MVKNPIRYHQRELSGIVNSTGKFTLRADVLRVWNMWVSSLKIREASTEVWAKGRWLNPEIGSIEVESFYDEKIHGFRRPKEHRTEKNALEPWFSPVYRGNPLKKSSIKSLIPYIINIYNARISAFDFRFSENIAENLKKPLQGMIEIFQFLDTFWRLFLEFWIIEVVWRQTRDSRISEAAWRQISGNVRTRIRASHACPRARTAGRNPCPAGPI